jgi:hypothetical protein
MEKGLRGTCQEIDKVLEGQHEGAVCRDAARVGGQVVDDLAAAARVPEGHFRHCMQPSHCMCDALSCFCTGHMPHAQGKGLCTHRPR